MLYLKKIYRTSLKFLQILVIFLISPIVNLLGFSLSPTLEKFYFFKFKFNNETRRIIFDTQSNKRFNKIFIDSTLSNSKLCELGKKNPCDKSPINTKFHRHGYTSFYNILFSTLINKKINFAEIGIWKNESIKMWRDYFKKAKIYGFEYYDDLIKNAKKDKLKKVFIKKINVKKEKSIFESFKKTNTKFDIIIDDSTHLFEDQIKIINNVHKFLKSGGYLIVEDIHKNKKTNIEENYFQKLKNVRKYFEDIFFVDTNHINKYSAKFNNDKLLVLIKK